MLRERRITACRLSAPDLAMRELGPSSAQQLEIVADSIWAADTGDRGLLRALVGYGAWNVRHPELFAGSYGTML